MADTLISDLFHVFVPIKALGQWKGRRLSLCPPVESRQTGVTAQRRISVGTDTLPLQSTGAPWRRRGSVEIRNLAPVVQDVLYTLTEGDHCYRGETGDLGSQIIFVV